MITLNNNTYAEFLESCRSSAISWIDVKRFKAYTTGATLRISMKNAERLLDQDPEIFDGLNVEFIDEDTK